MIPDILSLTVKGLCEGERGVKSLKSAYINRALHLKQGIPAYAYESTSSGAERVFQNGEDEARNDDRPLSNCANL